ncbi:PH domain-containing protein [Pontixanthobacter sp.]|uniref:PH domain-containing protein n=1 Tax=Pontixanthobacter sp. TaxID=2792078 RepID=UPI003C7D5C92
MAVSEADMASTMSSVPPQRSGEPLRKHPLSFVVAGIAGLQNALFPMVAAYFSMREKSWALLAALGIGTIVALVSAGLAYLGWRRFTYQIGETDIRVDSGILSRTARSVPFERIQDVSLEQTLLPRLLGLVQVKFETGAGGDEEIALRYLSEDQGETLRELVRARKDGAEAEAADTRESGDVPARHEDAPDVLFTMDQKRLLTFGLFEFSLAVFAVLAGLFQYVETFASIQLFDIKFWEENVADTGNAVSAWGPAVQFIAAGAGLVTLFIIGSVTGLVRTVLRDWGFVLERTAKGFRRRRGLLTKTDVVMPIHRVQAINTSTGFIRRRFGWHALKFVSLAQDSGGSSHDVAPFAKLSEIEPIARTAGFAIRPQAGARWYRGSRNYRIDSALIDLAVMLIIAGGVAAGLFFSAFASPFYAAIIVAAGIVLSLREVFLWRYDFNALDAAYVFARQGWLAPHLDVASRVKLQSVEIARGPIARRRGYATLHLGLAGGTLALEGLPVERARELRRAILDSISGTDFSELTG